MFSKMARTHKNVDYLSSQFGLNNIQSMLTNGKHFCHTNHPFNMLSLAGNFSVLLSCCWSQSVLPLKNAGMLMCTFRDAKMS